MGSGLRYFCFVVTKLKSFIRVCLLLFPLPSIHIMGNVGSFFQMEFFTYPGLSEDLAGSVFASLDHIPDYRLRPIIHILYRAPNFSKHSAEVLCKVTCSFLNENHGPFWRTWCCPVLRSTLTLCSAPCWALFSPTCCRLESLLGTFFFYFIFFSFFQCFHSSVNFNFCRDSMSNGRSSTRGHQQSERQISLCFRKTHSSSLRSIKLNCLPFFLI